MLLFYCLLCLSSFHGVISQTLTQSSSEIKKPGESMKMSCKGTGYQYASYYISWVQQIPGKGLTWIGRVHPTNNGDTAYSSSFQGRFTITTDASLTTSYLQIDNLKLEDSATYYCAIWERGPRWAFDIWGQGTQVAVTTAEKRGPTVFPLVPCCDIVSSLSAVTIGCLSTGYLPEPVDVTWNSGSITTGIRNLPGVLGTNGNYMSTSLLTVSPSEFQNNKYTCNVDHKATGTKINMDIGVCEGSTPKPPTVEVMQASCGETGSVDLVCFITGYSPDDIKIKWLLNGKETSISPTNSTPYKDSEGNFGFRSLVSVPKEDWSSGDTYTCRVSHPPSDTRNDKNIRKCTESSTASFPKVILNPPSPKQLLATKEPKVTCEVSQLINTESLDFKWKRNDGKRIQEFTSEPEQQYDGTYTVTSSLKISVADWESGKPFICTVEHSDLPSPVVKTIHKRNEPTEEPTIYIFPPPPEELSSYDLVTLSCLIKKFSPKNVDIQWKRNDIVMDEDKYTNTEPILDEETDTYFMYSIAIINKSDWNRGARYSCAGLLGKITEKEIKKTRGK